MIIYHETANQPLMLGWLRRTLKFWNQLTTMAHSPLCMSVLADNVRLGVTRGRHTGVWSRQLLMALRFVTDDPEVQWASRLSQLLSLDVESIMASAEEKWRTYALSKLESRLGPDDPACPHRPLVCHHTWFHPVTDLSHTANQPCPWYLAAGIPAEHQRALALLRTGNFPVRANTGRHQNIPFASRVCQRCAMGCVDTEPHCLLECLALGPVRARFSVLDFQQPLHTFLAHTTSKPVSFSLFTETDTLRPTARYVHAVHTHLMELAARLPPAAPPPPAPPPPRVHGADRPLPLDAVDRWFRAAGYRI